MLSRFPILPCPDADKHSILRQSLYGSRGSSILGRFADTMIEDDSECPGYTVQPVQNKSSPDPALLLRSVNDEAAYDDEPEGYVLDLPSVQEVMRGLT